LGTLGRLDFSHAVSRRRCREEGSAITLIAERGLRATFSRPFQGRILLFDLAAAESYAQIAGEARRAGRTVPHEDGLIAAIARAHGFAVATRNVSNFAGAGVELINPRDLP
jgi:predicted nucleic acid-binding protein